MIGIIMSDTEPERNQAFHFDYIPCEFVGSGFESRQGCLPQHSARCKLQVSRMAPAQTKGRHACPLSRHIPKPPKVSGATRQHREQSYYDDFVEVVESLWLDKALRGEAASSVRKLKKDKATEEQRARVGSDEFDGPLEKLSQLDET